MKVHNFYRGVLFFLFNGFEKLVCQHDKGIVCNTDQPKSCPLSRAANFSSKPSKNLLMSAYIKKELIVPCTGPYNTPILPVRKRNGKGWRLAPDLRSVNATVIPCHSVVLDFSPWTHDKINTAMRMRVSFECSLGRKYLLSLNVEHGPSLWESPVKLVGNRFKGPTQLCWASTSGGNRPICVRASLNRDDPSPRVVPYLLSLGLESQVEDAPHHKPDEADMGIYLKLFTWDVG